MQFLIAKLGTYFPANILLHNVRRIPPINVDEIGLIFSAGGVCIIDAKHADYSSHGLLECAKREE